MIKSGRAREIVWYVVEALILTLTLTITKPDYKPKAKPKAEPNPKPHIARCPVSSVLVGL